MKYTVDAFLVNTESDINEIEVPDGSTVQIVSAAPVGNGVQIVYSVLTPVKAPAQRRARRVDAAGRDESVPVAAGSES